MNYPDKERRANNVLKYLYFSLPIIILLPLDYHIRRMLIVAVMAAAAVTAALLTYWSDKKVKRIILGVLVELFGVVSWFIVKDFSSTMIFNS